MIDKFQIVYILGSGRCGSTLLDLMLNGHSQILGLGEISGLYKFKPLNVPDRISEKYYQVYIRFWKQVKHCYEDITGISFDQVKLHHPRLRNIFLTYRTKDFEKWAQPNRIFLECAHKASGLKILIDSTKRFQRLYSLQRSALFNIKVIHLMRDGRAVVNSYIQRYNDFKEGLFIWIISALSPLYLRQNFKKTDWLQVRYEELAINPEDTIKNICSFLKIKFESEMLAYRSHPYFGVAGNPLVKESEEEHIYLDERWKRELAFKYRFLFALIAGWLNKLNGYGF